MEIEPEIYPPNEPDVFDVDKVVVYYNNGTTETLWLRSFRRTDILGPYGTRLECKIECEGLREFGMRSDTEIIKPSLIEARPRTIQTIENFATEVLCGTD